MPTLLFALFLHLSAQGQVPSIAGTVVDASGAPISDATVRLEVSGAMVAEVHTASDGRFEFTLDVAGDARILAVAAGFAQASEPASSGNRSVQVRLQPAPFFEAVNVTSSRADAPLLDPTGQARDVEVSAVGLTAVRLVFDTGIR